MADLAFSNCVISPSAARTFLNPESRYSYVTTICRCITMIDRCITTNIVEMCKRYLQLNFPISREFLVFYSPVSVLYVINVIIHLRMLNKRSSARFVFYSQRQQRDVTTTCDKNSSKKKIKK